ncbi:MAG: response regulator [Azonexus sp.]|jgi:two-component system chemotaxis response regulator CheY|nr:response regulator [Betaproteobacteria bacterium]MBK8918296.1 response regulator [Betaproteobacteria bacterium]MBP6036154.1 response regulator [Azonexus sp.]MBP6906677.1 response regulator [Azonexus sp.]
MSRKRATVMIVDDNDMMRTLLRGILRAENYEVIAEARHGASAVEQAQLLKPRIVCMDVVMPEMDGLEALREIKSANPAIDIVMITGNACGDTVQEAIQNGASGFIVKPFNAAKVLDTLERVLAGKTLRPAEPPAA